MEIGILNTIWEKRYGGQKRRRGWNQHILRMLDNKLVKAARNGKPRESRSLGRPPKRLLEIPSVTQFEKFNVRHRRRTNYHTGNEACHEVLSSWKESK